MFIIPTLGSEINKIRPCVVVSPNELNRSLNTIIVAPLTSTLFTKDVHGDYSGAEAGLGGTNSDLSKFSAYWLAPNAPTYLLDYVETEFLLAEAKERGFQGEGTAATHYNAAIRASIIQAGGSSNDGDDYLDQPAVRYDNSSKSWREKIGYQKWIAFANRNWDSWTEIRRLGYPNIDQVNPPVNAISTLPKRLYYPSAEQTSNASNWEKAVAHIGGKDVVTAKLFWQQ